MLIIPWHQSQYAGFCNRPPLLLSLSGCPFVYICFFIFVSTSGAACLPISLSVHSSLCLPVNCLLFSRFNPLSLLRRLSLSSSRSYLTLNHLSAIRGPIPVLKRQHEAAARQTEFRAKDHRLDTRNRGGMSRPSNEQNLAAKHLGIRAQHDQSSLSGLCL